MHRQVRPCCYSETPICSKFCLFAILGEFVHNFVGVFAILFEVLWIQFQEEIRHFASWEGGGVLGTKIVNKHFVNKQAFPSYHHHVLWIHLVDRKWSIPVVLCRDQWGVGVHSCSKVLWAPHWHCVHLCAVPIVHWESLQVLPSGTVRNRINCCHRCCKLGAKHNPDLPKFE